MQTFLPFADYSESAQALDSKRLFKQCVENYQILLMLAAVDPVGDGTFTPRLKRWRHPVLSMWAGHERSLLSYHRATAAEWTSRGHSDSTLGKALLLTAYFAEASEEAPPWLGDERLHGSHRSNLLRKDAAHYGSLFPPATPTDLPYHWPFPSSASDELILTRLEARHAEAAAAGRPTALF